MFLREGGAGVGGRTEKQRPWAWLRLWYGSWPRMTALTVWRGVWRDLLYRERSIEISKVTTGVEVGFCQVKHRAVGEEWKLIPRVQVFCRRKNLLATLSLFLQETFQIKKVFAQDLIFKSSKPTLVQRQNLNAQQIFLFSSQLLNPFLLVKVRSRRRRRRELGKGRDGIDRARSLICEWG